MGVILDRWKAEFIRTGESVTFTKLGGTAGSFVCDMIVQVCSSGEIRTYFDDVTISGFTKPLIKGFVAGDSTVAVNDTFTRDTVTWTVQAVFKNRVANDVANITVLATHA